MSRARTVACLLALAALALASPAQAAEFKWAGQRRGSVADPHATTEFQTMALIGNLYEPLVRRDKDLKLEPALAKSWEVVSPTLWRFKLRKGVTFHDGAPFTADDVLATLQRSRTPGADAKTKVQSIADIKKIDDHTIEITTREAGSDPALEISDWFMTSKAWCEKNDAMSVADVRKGAENYATRNANGTGPFKLVSREPDVRTVLEANSKWWDKPQHNVTRATYHADLQLGDPHGGVAVGRDRFRPAGPDPGHQSAEGRQQHQGGAGYGGEFIFLGFDHKRDELLYGSVKDKNPFKDPRVRKAFNQAVDVNAIRQQDHGRRRGRARQPDRPADEGLRRRPRPAAWPLDPAAAKKLLAEAGYPGRLLPSPSIAPTTATSTTRPVCVAVAAMLGRIGVKVNVAAISKTKYFGKTLSRDTSFFMLGWGANTVDAHNPLAIVLGTPTPDGNGPWNMGAYSNPKLDEMTAQIRDEIDETKRNALIHKAFKMVIDDYAIIPLFEPALVWATRKNVKLDQRADERFELRSVVKN